MNPRFPIAASFLAAFLFLPALPAAEEIENALRELKSPSPEVRVSGLRDEGDSILPTRLFKHPARPSFRA